VHGLAARDGKGKAYAVRYEAVNAMLLNEFLKEHRKMQKQDATITRLEQQIEALTAGLQKVRAQLELSKSARQTVVNDQ
jgi:cell division protein FtsB